MAYIEMVTTKKAHGPRGDYYDWCAVREDGFLIFGDEQGNYSGGEFLTPEFYPGLNDYAEHQTSIDVGKGYWHYIRQSLESWKKRDSVFYEQIEDMVKRHGITIPKEPIPEVMI